MLFYLNAFTWHHCFVLMFSHWAVPFSSSQVGAHQFLAERSLIIYWYSTQGVIAVHQVVFIYLFIYLFIYQERSVHIRTYPPAYSWNLGKGYFLYSWIQCYHFALYWCLCFCISFILYYFINGLQETLQWGDRREIDLSCNSAHTQAQGRWYWWQTVTEFASQKGRRLTLSF